MLLRLNDCVNMTKPLLDHLEKRGKHKSYYRRGSPGRTFVALDENIVLHELKKILPWDRILTFMKTHNSSNDLFCVCAQWMHANSMRPQKPHRDHTHGYGRYFNIVFTIDGSKIDTMVEISGKYECANCNILVYDSFHSHFGPAGQNKSKVFIGFSNPQTENYNSIAREHLHARKKTYTCV